MKKNLYKISLCILILVSFQLAHSQMDTLLFEDFQIDRTDEYTLFPDVDTDTLWSNFDEDQLPAAQDFPSNWFFDLDWGLPDSIPPGDSNYVLVSRSWLTSLDTISSNWLMTPGIDIVDDQATLHWKSAPFQGPRYMDGYAVKIMDQQSFFDADMVDVIFRAAEMEAWIGDQSSTDPDSFLFSPGYIHANTYMDTIYFDPPQLDSAGVPDADLNLGYLEPHSVSLAAYAGQLIFIAFHHDSADDNLLMIDDILVMGTEPVSTYEPSMEDLRFVTYPNPVDNYLNVLYRLKESATIQVKIFNMEGKVMYELPAIENAFGEYSHSFDLRNFPSGSYQIVLNVNGKLYSKKIVKQ